MWVKTAAEILYASYVSENSSRDIVRKLCEWKQQQRYCMQVMWVKTKVEILYASYVSENNSRDIVCKLCEKNNSRDIVHKLCEWKQK